MALSYHLSNKLNIVGSLFSNYVIDKCVIPLPISKF